MWKENLWHSSNFGGNWRERGGPHSRELEQRRFWATHVNRKLTFCILRQWFCPNFRANRLYKAKINSNTDLFALRHFKREKASLPFDVRSCWLWSRMLIDAAVSKFGETSFRPQYLRFWLRAYKASFFSPWRSCAEQIWFRDCGETLSGVVVTTSSSVARDRLFWGEGDGKERTRGNCSWNDDKQVSPFLTWSLPTSALLWIFSVRCSGFTIAPRNHELPFGVNFGIFYLVIPNTRILW